MKLPLVASSSSEVTAAVLFQNPELKYWRPNVSTPAECALKVVVLLVDAKSSMSMHPTPKALVAPEEASDQSIFKDVDDVIALPNGPLLPDCHSKWLV